MCIDLKPDRTLILSDPLAAYSKLQPNAGKGQVTALGALWQRAQLLRAQQKSTKTATKILSSQIGKAKRNSEPTDDLMTSMQELSSQLKAIKTDLTDIEDQIIAFFDADGHSNSIEDTSTLEHNRYIGGELQSNAQSVSISVLGDEVSDWNTYVSSNAAASIYHRAEWRELAKKCYGLESLYLVARDDDGTVVGILPLFRLKSLAFGDYLVSMPYFMRGGALANHQTIEQKLMQSANDYAAKKRIDHIEYRDDVSRKGLPVRTDKIHMVLQLPESHDKLWKSFTPKLRSQIKRPQRENPQVYFGRKEFLDDFYVVYARNMRDLGSPAHSKKFIRSILHYFPDNSWIIVIRLNNKPVGAGLLLQHGKTVDIPLASTIRDFNSLGINMLMYWEILKFSIGQGCTHFDFGRSSADSGTYRFKRQWGARPKQLYLHYWLNEGRKVPSLNPSNPKYATVISIWKCLPVRLTRWIGPQIVKNLP